MRDPSAAANDGPAVRRLSAIDTVRARILLALQIGSLRPGDRVGTPREVASGLDVSPITARRAMEALVAERVLVRRRGAGGGTFVAERPARPQEAATAAYRADAAGVRRLIERRLLAEAGLAALAALRRETEDLTAIRAAVEACAAARDWAEFHVADRAFHLAVAAAAREPTASYRELYARLTAYFVPYPIDRLHASNRQHASILEAIGARDAGAAARSAAEHVAALHEDMFIGRPAQDGA